MPLRPLSDFLRISQYAIFSQNLHVIECSADIGPPAPNIIYVMHIQKSRQRGGIWMARVLICNYPQKQTWYLIYRGLVERKIFTWNGGE